MYMQFTDSHSKACFQKNKISWMSSSIQPTNMRGTLFVLASLCAVALALNEQQKFNGYTVLRAQVNNLDQAEVLASLEREGAYDFWTAVKKQGPVDIMAEGSQLADLADYLTKNDVSFSTMVEDVQDLIDQAKMTYGSRDASKQGHNMDWTSYHPLEDMYSFYDYIEANFDYASTETLGQSEEGRDMRVMKICKGGCGNKPAMWIDGGIHAREWITPATVTFFVKMLTEDLEDESLIDNLDWYILPSVNPDGYAYTQTDSRLWRKTRSLHNGDICVGTDANRNWGYHFNDGGSSDSSCSDTYHGPEAFSEVENRNVRDFVDANKDQIKFFNSIHSYSQYVLLPWGFTEDPCPDYDDLFALAERGVDALTAMYGTQYTIGCIPCLLYIASGGALDYALGTDGIKYAYSMELRDTGTFGFLLPESQITPTAEETWAFHVSAANDIVAEFGR